MSDYFSFLPIKTIEVSATDQTYDCVLQFASPMGRCCTFTPYKAPEPIVFKVPLDKTIMWPHQWLTRDKLEIPFLGVDRTIDPIRLAGIIYEAPKLFDVIPDGNAFLAREGARPDLIYKEGPFYYFLQIDTWAWIIKNGQRVALTCIFPGWNGIVTVANKT